MEIFLFRQGMPILIIILNFSHILSLYHLLSLILFLYHRAIKINFKIVPFIIKQWKRFETRYFHTWLLTSWANRAWNASTRPYVAHRRPLQPRFRFAATIRSIRRSQISPPWCPNASSRRWWISRVYCALWMEER